MELDIEKYNLMLSGLFDKHPSVQQVGFGGGAYKPGLDGMKGFDETLGSPWKGYPCIHVAGTNGKGSVSSMIANILLAGNLKTGKFISPHLVKYNERISINNNDITDDAFALVISAVKQAADSIVAKGK